MNAAEKKRREARYRDAIKALDGITGVMVRRGPQLFPQDAGTLVAVKGFVAVVKMRSGTNSGRTQEFPVDWVRPAAAFEVIT